MKKKTKLERIKFLSSSYTLDIIVIFKLTKLHHTAALTSRLQVRNERCYKNTYKSQDKKAK